MKSESIRIENKIKFFLTILVMFICVVVMFLVSNKSFKENCKKQQQEVLIGRIRNIYGVNVSVDELNDIEKEMVDNAVKDLVIDDVYTIKSYEYGKQRLEEWIKIYDKYLKNKDYITMIWLEQSGIGSTEKFFIRKTIQKKESVDKTVDNIKDDINEASYQLKIKEEKLHKEIQDREQSKVVE